MLAQIIGAAPFLVMAHHAPPPNPDQLDVAPAYVQEAFACIRRHESDNEPAVVNASSGDGGLYQFAVGTWLANGGGQFTERAQYATVVQQDDVALWTWQADGFTPWDGDNGCW